MLGCVRRWIAAVPPIRHRKRKLLSDLFQAPGKDFTRTHQYKNFSQLIVRCFVVLLCSHSWNCAMEQGLEILEETQGQDEMEEEKEVLRKPETSKLSRWMPTYLLPISQQGILIPSNPRPCLGLWVAFILDQSESNLKPNSPVWHYSHVIKWHCECNKQNG